MSNRPPRAALYARVSTGGQVTSDPWASLPRQLADLNEMARRMGFTVALEVEEQGSGAKATRPGWVRVLEAARAGEVDVICAVSFDRLTRSEKLGDWEVVKDELRSLGVRLATVKQGEIDLRGSADAEMLSDVQAVWAKGERLKIRERTYSGRVAKAKAGGYGGGNIPYGYVLGYDPRSGEKVFTIQEEEAAVVRDLFARFNAGVGVNELTRQLIQRHVTPPGRPHGGPPGEHWFMSTVQGILKNPTYAGLQSWRADRGPLVPSTVFPPLVDLEVWQQAQREREVRAHRSPRGGHTPYPLSGILRCPACAGKMNHYQAKGIHYYRCSRDWRLGESACPERVALNAAACEEVVIAYLRERLGDLLTPEAVKRGRRPAPPPTASLGLARLEKELGRLERERTHLLRWAMADPETREGESEAALGQYREEIKAVQRQLAEARKAPVAASAVSSDFALQLLEVLDELAADPASRRHLFDAALLEVVCERTSAPRARPQTVRVSRCLLRGNYLL